MSQDVYTLYSQARQLLAERDGAAAIPLLESAAGQLPGDPAILRLLALAYNDTGELTAAESTLRALVRLDPLDADALHMLGKALEHTGRPAEAGRYLSLAAGLDPAYSASCSVWAGDPEKENQEP